MQASRLLFQGCRQRAFWVSGLPRAAQWTRYSSTAFASIHDIRSSVHPTLPPVDETISTKPEFVTLEGVIDSKLLHAITVDPFQHKNMTPVQSEVLKCLPSIAEPFQEDSETTRDLLVKARTGTGKTLAFLIPAIEQRLKSIEVNCQRAVQDAGLLSDKNLEARARKSFTRKHNGVLIISPTRELATQIANEAVKLTRHLDGFGVHLMVGGMSKYRQIKEWHKLRRDITVVTPGRLRDLLQTEPEIVSGISQTPLLILDEADTLLDMGFRDDIAAIDEYLPKAPERQTFMFSATVPRNIQQLARTMLSPNHKFLDCVDADAPLIHPSIKQYHTVLPSAGDQLTHTLRLIAHDQLTNLQSSKIVLFLPTTKMTQLYSTLIAELSRSCFPYGKQTRVFDLHSKKSQDQRTRASNAFRSSEAPAILVTTDVSARGVDYPGVTRVIQVGIPSSPEQYVHRVGRTGRAGCTGRADLVLQDWEIGFVSFTLVDQKLKPLTVKDLKDQVSQLAAEHDKDPISYCASRMSVNNRLSLLRGDIQSPLVPVMEDVPRNCRDIVGQLDEAAVGETFASLLGYYVPKAPELRTTKPDIVDGLKAWSMDAGGLSRPPYVSNHFLQQLGFDMGHANKRGSKGSRNHGKTSRRDHGYKTGRYDRS